MVKKKVYRKSVFYKIFLWLKDNTPLANSRPDFKSPSENKEENLFFSEIFSLAYRRLHSING